MTQTYSLEEELAFAGRLAEAAWSAIRPHFRALDAVDNKLAASPADFDPVTVADTGAEAAMRALIEAERPDHGITGEEFPAKSSNNGFTWLLDPIDGTRAFVAGLPSWTTLIALCDETGTPVIGVIDQPVLDELIEERARLSAERDFYRAQCQCVARAATLPWPKPTSARWGFDRDLVVAHLRQELASVDAAPSASLRRVLVCCLIVWCRHAIPTYEHFKRLLNQHTLGGNLLLKRGPAILVDFDEKSAEISSLPRFRRFWRRAARRGEGGRAGAVLVNPWWCV